MQTSLDAGTVRRLLTEQFPDWAHLSVRPVASHGTVNAIFRIGAGLTARFPLRRTEDPGEIEEIRRELRTEAYAAKRIAGTTRFPTPEPVALGEPGAGFPLPWSVQTWLPGTVATDADPGASILFAHDLAELITGLRAAGTGGDTFRGHGRGGVLADHDEDVRDCLARSERLLPVPDLRSRWETLRDLPRGPDPDVMSHGDLMPGNLLVDGNRLTGVLDVGGFRAADPALDLICAWHLLDPGPRHVLRAVLGCDDAEWARGQGWALAQSLGLVWYYEHTNPVMAAIGRRTLRRILADPAG